jgi:hypothetical protein
MRAIGILAFCTVLLPAAAFAQETPAADTEQYDDRPQIRVLENPYDLASFYRSDGFVPANGYSDLFGRYPIAAHYRGEASDHGWSRFWTNGYSNRYTSTQGRAAGGFDYRRGIGQNGDLFLLAPTFLAPVGPLSDFFFYSSGR